MLPRIVLPALTFFDSSGEVDRRSNSEYAERAAATCADLFLLFGSTGEGEFTGASERELLLATWLEHVPAERVIVRGKTTDPGQAGIEARRGVSYMAPPWPNENVEELVQYLHAASAPVYLYSHPDHSSLRVTPSLLENLSGAGCLPKGAKVSKVSVEELRTLRGAAPSGTFDLWHGTDRDLRASFQAGADAVVSQTVGSLRVTAQRGDVAALQVEIDQVRNELASVRGAKKIARLKGIAIETMPMATAVTR